IIIINQRRQAPSARLHSFGECGTGQTWHALDRRQFSLQMEHLLGHSTPPQFAPGTTTPWLGFNHYAQEATTFDSYFRNRGWDFKELLDGDIKVPHDELPDATDKTPATMAAAAIQS